MPDIRGQKWGFGAARGNPGERMGRTDKENAGGRCVAKKICGRYFLCFWDGCGTICIGNLAKKSFKIQIVAMRNKSENLHSVWIFVAGKAMFCINAKKAGLAAGRQQAVNAAGAETVRAGKVWTGKI